MSGIRTLSVPCDDLSEGFEITNPILEVTKSKDIQGWVE
jgi:hypothetical protein